MSSWKSGMAALGAGLVFAIVGAGMAQETPQRGGTLNYGMVTEIASLDPHVYTGSSWKVLNHTIYGTLLTYDKKGQLVPGLAASWQASADAKSYTFALRKGVKFHKGQEFGAKDVKYTIERIMDPATGATLKPNFDGTTVTVIDDHTVRIDKAEPDATLLGILALPEAAIVSEAWMKTQPNVKAEMNGTGPFVLAEYEPKVRAVVRRNPAYHEEGQPYLDAVNFRMIANGDARVNALRTGAVDMIEFVPWKDIDVLKGLGGIEVQTSGGAFMNLWVNPSRKPFDNPKVRQALNFAIDRAAISKAGFFGHGSPLAGPPSTPDSPFHNKDFEGHFSYNPAKAKALLAEAGVSGPLDVDMVVFQGLAIYTTTAQVVQANLKDLGINAKIRLLEWANVVDSKDKAQYDLMVWGVNVKLPDPDAYAYYFGSDSPYWAKPVSYRDAVLDDLLKKARGVTDLAARKAIYREAEQRILEQSPWVFINWRDQAQAYKAKVKGYVQLGGALSESAPGIALPTLWMKN